MEKFERVNTHEEDPEHRKDEVDILGKMMNMISSLREELSNLWTKNAVLEKELSILKPNAVLPAESVEDKQPVLCDHEGDKEEALDPTPYERDGGKANESVDDVCKVKCVHCDAETEKDKSCCNKPACEECDKFGKWAKDEKVD
jgi:hypothetical protein